MRSARVKERFRQAYSGQPIACKSQCGMSALRLQADGIRGGQEFDVSPVRPLFYAVYTETGPEAADDRRSGCAGDFLIDFWQIRGFLEASNQFGCRVFRM